MKEQEMITVYFPVWFELDTTNQDWDTELWTSGFLIQDAHTTFIEAYKTLSIDIFDDFGCEDCRDYRNIMAQLAQVHEVQIKYDDPLKHPKVYKIVSVKVPRDTKRAYVGLSATNYANEDWNVMVCVPQPSYEKAVVAACGSLLSPDFNPRVCDEVAREMAVSEDCMENVFDYKGKARIVFVQEIKINAA